MEEDYNSEKIICEKEWGKGEKSNFMVDIETRRKATIKTSIEWCEYTIELLEEEYDIIESSNKYKKSLQQLRTHLNWLKEQEKNDN